MSKEKQIEEKHELSTSIYMSGYGLLQKDCDDIAEQLYEEGYRKQSEGEWLFNWSCMCLEGTDAPLNYKCSLCDEYATDPFSFCPNCGAKMKGGEEQ